MKQNLWFEISMSKTYGSKEITTYGQLEYEECNQFLSLYLHTYRFIQKGWGCKDYAKLSNFDNPKGILPKI